MKKILMIALFIAAVFLVSMINGGGLVYGFNGPSISPDEGIAYHQTLSSESSYAMKGETLSGPIISQSEGAAIAFDKTLSSCPIYALNKEVVSGPVVSAETNGAMRGTEDGVALVAMWCR